MSGRQFDGGSAGVEVVELVDTDESRGKISKCLVPRSVFLELTSLHLRSGIEY
jgi:hypothetical protein